MTSFFERLYDLNPHLRPADAAPLVAPVDAPAAAAPDSAPVDTADAMAAELKELRAEMAVLREHVNNELGTQGSQMQKQFDEWYAAQKNMGPR